MPRLRSLSIWVAAALSVTGYAQTPTGTILGTVTDPRGAFIPGASINITNQATGGARKVVTNAVGLFSVPALPAGEYEVRAEMKGFRTIVRPATVLVGETTTVDLAMTLGEENQVITVEAAAASINYENHNIQGVIEQSTIQELPLNGRSYVQLASLEPGVTVTAGSTAQFNALQYVSVRGSGFRTVYTVDGGNISDNIDTQGGGQSMNLSQDIVEEFQLSELNFDLSTPIAAGGAMNIVTRSGTNSFHGSAYFYFRDHNMAAYPALHRSPLNPNPFFARRDPGVYVGGPIKKDKLFFFVDFEHMTQVQAISVQGNVPSFAPLTGVFSSPYHSKQFTAKFDYHISAGNTMFARYSHDGNDGFGQVFTFGNPSNWVRNQNWADQNIVGLTSILSAAVVNDLRVQYQVWSNHNLQSVSTDCVSPCIGVGLPSIFTVVGSNFPAIGPNFNAPQTRNTRRYEINDGLSWQKGAHRIRFGGDINRPINKGQWGFCTPFCAGVYAPEFIRGLGLGFLFPNLPTTITSNADILNLPVLNLGSSIFSGIGVGSTNTPAPYLRQENMANTQYRAYVQDTWKLRPNLTVNYGIAWNAQVGYYNSNLSKPQFLAPILGANNLGPTANNWKEFQPAVGVAWSPGKSSKTVIRAGGGIYWDATPGYYKYREAASIGPPGDGRSTLSSTAFVNTIPGIFNLSARSLLPVNAPIPLGALTTMTLGQFEQVVNQQLPSIAAKLAPPNPQTSGPYSVSGIDIAKSGVEIYPQHYPLGRTYQTSIGIQRDLGHDMVLTADWARSQGENISLGERDLNLSGRYINGVPVPVIRPCASSELFAPGIECSSGAITVFEDEGRSVYEGLLVKLTKRLSHRVQGIVSYALQNQNGNNVWNELNWFSGYGPTPGLSRHDLNVAGTVHLPKGFDVSVNSTYLSRPPVEATIPNIALPGTDVTGAQMLPGLGYNCLNFGCDKTDLANAVNAFNSTWAGQKDSKGNLIPTLVLPSHYQLGDPILSQDFRVTKGFAYHERYRLNIFGEVFNTFNIANLTGYAFSLDTKVAPTLVNPNPVQTFTFGQPTQRAGQVFGSGGPRAFQVGARFSF